MSRIDPRNPIYRKMLERTLTQAIQEDLRNMVSAAEVQAWASNHKENILNTAGRLLFITLGAAQAQGMAADTPDIRVLLGMGSALGDLQADGDVDRHRPAIQAGLMAAQRLLPYLLPMNIVIAAEALDRQLQQGGVGMANTMRQAGGPA